MEVGLSTGEPDEEEPESENAPSDWKEMFYSTARKLCNAVQTTNTKATLQIRNARKTLNRRRRCWEVYVGIGLVSKHLRALGVEVTSFGLETGWDLTDTDHQKEFLRMMDTDEPDEIRLSPMCGPWSQVQELNNLTPESKESLRRERAYHHTKVLTFAKTVFNKQVLAGRYAHLEHPTTARSWRTKAFSQLMAKHFVELDQCEYGLSINGEGLNKKPTTVATNKDAMCKLHRKCQKNHTHIQLLGNRRTKKAEHCPPDLANKIAYLMSREERSLEKDDVYPVDDDASENATRPENETENTENQEPEIRDGETYAGDGHLERMANLKREVWEQVSKYVRKLHNGMGHPSAKVLAQALANGQAREEVIRCAEKYECAVCKNRRPPPSASKSGPPPAQNFNDRVQADIFVMLVLKWVRLLCCTLSTWRRASAPPKCSPRSKDPT